MDFKCTIIKHFVRKTNKRLKFVDTDKDVNVQGSNKGRLSCEDSETLLLMMMNVASQDMPDDTVGHIRP